LAALEAALGATLPDDLRDFATHVASGGAGPYYGIVPIDRGAAYVVTSPSASLSALPSASPDTSSGASSGTPAHAAAPQAPWTRGLPISHLGCGYTAIVALDGAARGEVWIDARTLGVSAPIAPSFTAFMLDWIDRVAHGRWPLPHVPPGVCPLAAALSGYLAHCEAERGLPAGSLTGDALRASLSRLGQHAIEIAADASISASAAWFADGDRVDPCVACAQLVDHLAADGLRRDVVAPGLPPLPLR
ncbi:MAG TPA: SMI1/KNR4 family protein, partial [Kofleriaceae bacterium]|nr:SMI1/KNR4 family protein [Kofleriaceae bacterium]